jgi:hypothetical protein
MSRKKLKRRLLGLSDLFQQIVSPIRTRAPKIESRKHYTIGKGEPGRIVVARVKLQYKAQ